MHIRVLKYVCFKERASSPCAAHFCTQSGAAVNSFAAERAFFIVRWRRGRSVWRGRIYPSIQRNQRPPGPRRSSRIFS